MLNLDECFLAATNFILSLIYIYSRQEPIFDSSNDDAQE